MAKLSNENLFLMEFLVEDLQIDKCDCNMPPGELCICFQFLDNTELDVCEHDFSPNKKFSPSNDNNRIGKSCLFSLTPSQAQAALQSFDLIVSVCKKMQPGYNPEKICMGSANISVVHMLSGLLQSNEKTPAAKVLQENFQLMDATGRNVGTIGVYIRMSCYGKMIITQFQMNLDDKSVLFKDKEGRSLYRYKKSKKKGKTTKIEDLSQNEQDCDPNCKAYKIVDQPPEQFINQGQFPANPSCPSQPCFPNGPLGFDGGPSPFASAGVGGPFTGLRFFGAPTGLGGPSAPVGGPFSFGASPVVSGPSPPGFGGPQSFGGPPSFPPPNPNCPMQPCFPNTSAAPEHAIRPPFALAAGPSSKSGARSAPPEVNMFYPPCLSPQTTTMPLAGYPGPQFPRDTQTRFSAGLGGSFEHATRQGGCGGGCGR
ncbi:DUF4497 domain containing protein [Asbolus verrucosus]|uniref:DUF4497 domain containing protein n=1 Tax=Asbolus verrucosus TaxID=1661398 RepID=A0A482W2F2_ASBVE|nr:DUF4497 domain containing protein [Asbolus verrucosus]